MFNTNIYDYLIFVSNSFILEILYFFQSFIYGKSTLFVKVTGCHDHIKKLISKINKRHFNSAASTAKFMF